MNPLIGVIILTTLFKVSKPQVLNSATSFPFLKEEATEHRARTIEVRSKQKIPLRVALPSQAERRHTSLSQRKEIVPEHVRFTNGGALDVLMDIWKKISTRLSHPLLELSATNT